MLLDIRLAVRDARFYYIGMIGMVLHAGFNLSLGEFGGYRYCSAGLTSYCAFISKCGTQIVDQSAGVCQGAGGLA